MNLRGCALVASGLVFWFSGALSAQTSARVSPDSQAPAPPASPAPDTRTQYPPFLLNSYVSLSAGLIGYPFSTEQLEPGYHAAGITIPHAAIGVVLLGHRFNKFVSADIAYMRPIKYVMYQDVNETGGSHSVWMAFGEFMLKSQAPISPRTSIYGSVGLGITNRTGFSINGAQVVKDAHFTSPVVGVGVDYQASRTVDLSVGVTYLHANLANQQPHTLFAGGGFRYTMRPLPADRVRANAEGGFIFPANVVQVGYATNVFGYGANNFVSKTVPIFWSGDVTVDRGISLRYERNVFHTRKVFGLDLGASVSHWVSGTGSAPGFVTLSAYPVLRFTVLRERLADLYLCYSLAGPTFVSVTAIDGHAIGTNRFTFQDFVGAGVFAGADRRFTVGISLTHYSNGNLFPRNPGVTIPLMVTVGYAY